MIFDRTMLAYMDEQGEMGLLEPISILFCQNRKKCLHLADICDILLWHEKGGPLSPVSRKRWGATEMTA